MQRSIPTQEELTVQLGRVVLALFKRSQRDVLAQVAEMELSMSTTRMLFILDGSGREWSLRDMAATLGLSDAATSRAVDQLVRLGLVTRREDELDRRVKRIALSDAGHELTSSISAARRDAVRRVVESLGDEDRATVAQGLEPLLAVLFPSSSPSSEVAS